MKTRMVAHKIICFVLLSLVAGVLLMGSDEASAKNKKGEKCTLKSVTVMAGGQEYTFEGGLRPVEVPADVDWETFFSSMTVVSYQVIESDACVQCQNSMLTCHFANKKGWKPCIAVEVDETTGLYENQNECANMALEYQTEYNDIKFQFTKGVADDSSTGIFVRFVERYDITYDLAGGTFQTEAPVSYGAERSYLIPNPVKVGYEFAGWTGTDVLLPTTRLAIAKGSSGNRSYTAAWKALGSETTENQVNTFTASVQNVQENVNRYTQLLTLLPTTTQKENVQANVSVQDSKAKYKITSLRANKREVKYVAPKNKKAKSITIPATVKLSDGTVAKVTSMEAEALKGCKNLKKLTIKTTSLTKKSVGKNAFKGIQGKAVIQVPKKKLASYKVLLKAKGVTKKAIIKK